MLSSNMLELLNCALLQCKYHSVRQDLFSQLIPLFLANHTATSSVIQFAWISQVECQNVTLRFRFQQLLKIDGLSCELGCDYHGLIISIVNYAIFMCVYCFISQQKMCPHSPNMVLQAMADWYMQGDTPDQSRLPRILDVAQDPKVKAALV